MSRSPEELRRERDRWRDAPRRRPGRIVPPGPGQESVWDYPRPPRVEPARARVRVEFAGRVIASSSRAMRVCETASPPTYYIASRDVRTEWLEVSPTESLCEWKGVARYYTIRIAQRSSVDAAWSYPEPFDGYESLRDCLAFYPGRVDACFVGAQRVEPQPGGFYGGWITPDVTGPFKGTPGTEGW